MRKHEPKPHVEEHFHIQELIAGQEKRSADREYHRNKKKSLEDREKTIALAKIVDIKEFYCLKCKEDFANIVHKQVEVDWTNPNQRIAFYKTKHKCGQWAVRYITDSFFDPYWMQSPQVIRNRGKYYKDLIQPFQEGFNLLYGKK